MEHIPALHDQTAQSGRLVCVHTSSIKMKFLVGGKGNGRTDYDFLLQYFVFFKKKYKI